MITLNKISIAIDGPAAAGKSTVAKLVADQCSYIYVDTGAMYRALTYQALRRKVDLEHEEALAKILDEIIIELKPSNEGQLVFINNEEVTKEIRNSDVTNKVSIVARHKKVREEMVKRQKMMAASGGVVMDGRDIGTHVIPNAEVKVFLLASVKERAERRHRENMEKGYPSDIEKLKEEIARRDQLDTEREVSPLKKADDAVEIDTTSLSIEEVVTEIMKLVKERA